MKKQNDSLQEFPQKLNQGQLDEIAAGIKWEGQGRGGSSTGASGSVTVHVPLPSIF